MSTRNRRFRLGLAHNLVKPSSFYLLGLSIAVIITLFTARIEAQERRVDPWRPQYIVDLSHELHEGFPWIEAPGTFPFSSEPIATIEEVGVAANRWEIHEHLGTQIDAPSHFAQNGRNLNELRPDELFAPIVVIDFKDETATNVDAEVTIEHIEDWENRHGQIPEGAIVVMNSGWEQYVEDPVRYINIDESGTKRFPGFSAEAAAWLMDDRNAWGVGVDTISFDPGYDNEYKAHKALEARDGWAIEALANLDEIPPVGATLIVGAVNVRGATGGLVRPIAVWSDNDLSQSQTPFIEGQWRSEAPEPIPDGEGGFRYLTRSFTFEEERWEIHFTMHADESRETLLFSGHNEGVYTIEPSQTQDGAFYAQFGFDDRALIPAVDGIANALTEAQCGSEPWIVGEKQSVFPSGCEAFRIFSKEDCEAEFDVVKIAGGKLFLGARPADGFMCSPETRPKQAGTAPLVRIN